jgi:hypothetical protein
MAEQWWWTLRVQILGLQGGGLLAVPPLLQLRGETLGEEGDHGEGRAGSGLEQLHRVGRAAPCGQIGNEASSHTPPAGFLAPPGEAAAGPGKILPIEEATTGAKHPIAVLPPRAGLQAARSKHRINQLHHTPCNKKATLQGGSSGGSWRGLSRGIPQRGFRSRNRRWGRPRR